MSKFLAKKYILFYVAMFLVVVIGGVAAFYLLNPNYIIDGKIIDAESGKSVKGVTIRTAEQEVTTGEDGVYEIKNIKKDTALNISVPPEYETLEATVDYQTDNKESLHTIRISNDLDLTPTEAEKTNRVKKDVEAIIRDLMFGKYAEEYDAMEPDSKARISKEDYVKTAQEAFKAVSLTDYKLGDVKFLDKWNASPIVNKDYFNVAEVEVTYVGQIMGISQTVNKVTHYIKIDGQWRWFYAPGS